MYDVLIYGVVSVPYNDNTSSSYTWYRHNVVIYLIFSGGISSQCLTIQLYRVSFVAVCGQYNKYSVWSHTCTISMECHALNAK